MTLETADAKIFLVGFMGAGKTSLGRMLSDGLGWGFHDLDEAIEHAEGATIIRIFLEKGEPYFRRREAEVLAGLAGAAGRAVVACGGGTFCSAENRELMHRRGISVWIDQPFERIWSRRDRLARHRPLLRGEGQFRALYEQRRPAYGAATMRLPVEEGRLAEAAARLLRMLREAERPAPGKEETRRR